MTIAPSFAGQEVPLANLTGEELRARTARARLYLIDMAPHGNSSEPLPEKALLDHLAYLVRLEEEGRLYGAGPVHSTETPGGSLAIIAAASEEEAERIAVNEPLHKAGLRRNTLRLHLMNEGVACYVGRALAAKAEIRGDSFDPDLKSVQASYQELAARAVGASLFLVPLDATSKQRPDDDTRSGEDHMQWLRENEMSAKLMSCGPVRPPHPEPGIWGSGLGVVATNRAEAERIASVEPSGVLGYRKLSVVPWTMSYGLAAPIGKALEKLNAI